MDIRDQSWLTHRKLAVWHKVDDTVAAAATLATRSASCPVFVLQSARRSLGTSPGRPGKRERWAAPAKPAGW
jgi:hypothetical protein